MFRSILLSLAFIVTACQADSPSTDIVNRFAEADSLDTSAVAKTLRNCLKNTNCKTQDTARHLLAITILGDQDRGTCEWVLDQSGALKPVALGAKDDTGVGAQALSINDWAALDADQAQALLSETSLIETNTHDCDIDDQSAAFAEAYDFLMTAHAGGNLGATNELALLYIDDPEMFDLTRARALLEPCHAKGGGYCAFNLARVESLTSEDGCGQCIGLMRTAQTRTNDAGMRFMYAQAKKRLGRGAIVGRVFVSLSYDGGAQDFLKEFDVLFPRLAVKAASPADL